MTREHGIGYDLINGEFYHIDPDSIVKGLDLLADQFFLFKKCGDPKIPENAETLVEEGKHPLVYRLKYVPAGHRVYANLYDKSSKAHALLLANHQATVQLAESLKYLESV